MPKFSVKKPFVVLVGVIMVLVLGIVSFTKMTTDFFPQMNMPYMMVITTYPGASPEKVKKDITEVVENGVGTVNGVKTVTSTSSENYSTVMLEFEEKTNMDSAMVKVSSKVNQLELPEDAGKPIIQEISMDMMPTMELSVDMKGKKGAELTKYVEEKVIPILERQDGVASVTEAGNVKESVQVKLNQTKIDKINGDILDQTNKSLKKAKDKMDKAQKKLDDGLSKINDQESGLESKQSSQTAQLAKFSKMMNQAIANKEAYNAQLISLNAQKSALEMEKSAYTKAKIPETYKKINDSFQTARKEMSSGKAYDEIYKNVYNQFLVNAVQTAVTQMGIKATVKESNVNTYLDKLGKELSSSLKKTAETQAKQITDEQVGKQLQNIPESIQDAINSPSKLTAFQSMMKKQGQTKAAKSMTSANLKKMYQIVEVRIPQIDTELANLKTKITAQKMIVEKMKSVIAKAESQYEQVEQGKITAAAAFGSASAQLSSAKQSLENGQKELDNAKKTFESSKKKAIKNANLDQLLSMDQLAQILKAQNFSMPAGYIGEDGSQYLVKIGDTYGSMEELQKTLLCHMKGVGDVRLSDVADVTVVDNSADSYAKVNGNDGIVLVVKKASTAGTSSVSKTCNKAIKDLEKQHKGLRILNLLDQGEYIKQVVDSVISNLLWGALLAVIVLALFLKDVRPTVVVAFSIPMSVLFAIVLMYFTNITLNVVSLSGLALGIGMLVDNSIVVIENIYRLRSQGVSAARAAVKGANQVAGAIFSSTLTTICVFLPIVFTDGITRQMMMDMCLTITYSLCASFIVALTVVPSMGATLLRTEKQSNHRFFDALIRGYDRVIRFCLKYKPVPILIAVALLVFSAIQVTRMGMVLMPSMGSDQMSVNITAPDDTKTSDDYVMLDEISKKFRKIAGVRVVGGISQNSMASMGGSTSKKDFTIMVLLKKSYASKNVQIANKMEDILKKSAVKDYQVQKSNMDMSGSMSSGLTVNIYGRDTDKLLKISNDVMDMVKKVKGFENISNGQEDGDKEVTITVDKDKAMRYGLTVAQVFGELSGKIKTEEDSTTITVSDNDYDVKIVDDRDEIQKENIADHVFESSVMGSNGKMKKVKHKLSEFATISEKTGVASLSRKNLVNRVQVTAETKEGENATLLSRKLQKLTKKYKLDDGYEIEVAGESEDTAEMSKNMLMMIGLAIVFIYLVMVAQFQSLLSPFIVIFTIPLAFTGGLLALLISGQEISLMALMGFLVLSGVVVNNGIVFVDYANQLRIAGAEKREALVETGKTRMRPILMTALTTILAMSTMVLSKDSSADMSRGMAIVTIGGLAYATLMTLFIVPVLYDIFYRKKELHAVDLGNENDLD